MRLLRGAAAVAAIALVPAFAAAAPAARLSGVDLSHWNGAVNWEGLVAGHRSFVFAKATEGRSIVDPTYGSNRAGAGQYGLRFGAYHFARPQGTGPATLTADALAQADAFVGYAQPAAGDLLPVLDLERSNGLSPANLSAWTSAWLVEVEARLGVKPIIYSGSNFWRVGLANTTAFADAGYKLWYARYTRARKATAPASDWGGSGWTFWQWTSCARIPGLARCGDADRFRGASLAAVTIPAVAPQPPVVTTAPTVVGTPQSGRLLAAVPGLWTGGKPAAFAYQWESCAQPDVPCTSLPGATGETYRAQPQDVGTTLAVAVTATNASGSATATASTVPIAAPPAG